MDIVDFVKRFVIAMSISLRRYSRNERLKIKGYSLETRSALRVTLVIAGRQINVFETIESQIVELFFRESIVVFLRPKSYFHFQLSQMFDFFTHSEIYEDGDVRVGEVLENK